MIMMRRMSMLIVAALCVAGLAGAGEAKRMSFLDGVYSVEVPEGWVVDEAAGGSRVAIREEAGAACRVTFSAPNPDVGGKLTEYAKSSLDALFASLGGGGEIVGEQDNAFKGNPAHAIVFKIPADASVAVGVMGAMDFDGFVVVMVASGPPDEFEKFLRTAGAVIESYEIDLDLARKNKDKLAALAKETAGGASGEEAKP